MGDNSQAGPGAGHPVTPPPPAGTAPTSGPPDVPDATRAGPGDVRWPRQQATIFLVWGLVVAVVGLIDSLGADEAGTRLRGVLLLVTGAVTIGGALAGWPTPTPGQPQTGRRVVSGLLLAATLSALLSAFTAITVLRNYESQVTLVVALVVAGFAAIVSVTAAAHDFLVWRSSPRGATTTATALRKQWADHRGAAIGAIATLLAALVAVPQFWYSSQYLPSRSEPVITITNTLTRVRPHGSGMTATAQILLKNTGQAPVTVLASLYKISGTRITAQKAGTGLDVDRLSRLLPADPGPSARYGAFASYGDAELVQFGQVVMDQAWLEPGESSRATMVAFFPRGRFDLLRLTTDITFVRQDRISVGEPLEWNNITDPSRENLSIFTGCRDQLVELRVWPIEDHSLFDRLTRGRREVMTVLQLGPEHGTPQSESPWWPSPEAIASLQHTGKDCGHALENQPGGLEAESRFSTAGAVSETTVPR